MRLATEEDSALSREELDALLEEMPRILSDRSEEVAESRCPAADVELQRAHQDFAFEQGLALSNRHQRVVQLSVIGHREIESPELAELMLPTDLVAAFQVLPKGQTGYLLLSRPLFFQLLSMSFGAGPTIKPTRPPTRDYTRIERRFYERLARGMLEKLESAWGRVGPVELGGSQLVDRSAVAEGPIEWAVLATFDVKGLSEACRVRVVIPLEPFERADRDAMRGRARTALGPGVSLLEVPIRVRARVGTAELTLAELGRLEPGQLIELDTPGDGSLEIQVGGRTRFRGVAGTQGARRAVQLISGSDERSHDDG